MSDLGIESVFIKEVVLEGKERVRREGRSVCFDDQIITGVLYDGLCEVGLSKV